MLFHSTTKTLLKPTLALLTLALALSGGPLVSRADMGHGHTSNPGMSDSHHSTLEIPAGQPVPTINLVAYPDPVQGWNLEIQTTNFSFAPEQVNQANSPGAGHGHIYINGEKVSRIYGPWLHLPQLPSGRNEITVGLNTNSHQALTHNGQKIESTVVVDVP
ncbi:hypothetical protein ACQ4N7_07775 [Nodosilinea sp. AN01ver1]|uniref:hypothetical protein n=1 Tax=Nodosilinea sp. AN01ver1 TaxID=3423362 RepID=UPI003D310FE2